MKQILFIIISGFTFLSFSQVELYEKNQTYTYKQAIQEYVNLKEAYPSLSDLQEFGSSDYGLPISLFLISKDGEFYPREYANKNVLFNQQ